MYVSRRYPAPIIVTISDMGMVYFAVFMMYGGDGVDSFFKLDSIPGRSLIIRLADSGRALQSRHHVKQFHRFL
jgi:hypothetical protein